MSDTEGHEEYDARGSYTLRVTADAYEIWDRRDPSHPIGSFPGTDAGLDAAEQAFERLVRDERKDRDPWSPSFRWTLFIAIGVWVVATTVSVVLSLVLDLGNIGSTTPLRWAQIIAAVGAVSFAVWVAALVALVALWLRRNGRVVEQRLTGRESADTTP